MQSDFKPFRRKQTPPQTAQNPASAAQESSPAADTTTTPKLSPEPVRAAGQPASLPEPAEKPGFMHFSWTFGRKATIALAALAVLLIGGGLYAVAQTRPDGMGGTYVSKRPPKPVIKPVTVPSSLSGLPVLPEINERPVTGVMIENSREARPQSGLSHASVIFEAIAEGGITRFLALFQDNEADSVGPVRSVRPYYVQWCMSFDCAISHAGGSPEALANIRAWGTKDLDQFANSAPYTRVADRYAPHNLYSSIPKLRELETAKGYGKATFTPLARKAAAPSKTPAASQIQVNISSGAYNSSYSFDAKANTYARNQNGAPHMVVASGDNQVQLAPSVIVALTMPYGVAADKHSQYGVVGSGEARVLQDGMVTVGTWSKADVAAPLSLTGADGQPLALNPGQTWFVAVASSGLVTYK